MTTKDSKKLLCEETLRHAEYYGMQSVLDGLYEKSKNGEEFTDLLPMILSRENILLAYRNIKANTGSKTAGTDKTTIGDIGRLTPDEVVQKVRDIVSDKRHGYRPKPVRRKDIPKPYDPTKTRPLGIPCMWDRLVQQCIKQIMEPICEAKFSRNSYGFRPGRSVEHAINRSYRLLQLSNLHYVVEFDIKGFFDNVNHSKLIRQIWAMGIHDKKLLFIIKRILKAPIKMPDGKMVIPTKGTPQGGIISPLLANIVLNELDHWVDGQWESNPVIQNYSINVSKNGDLIKSNAYRAMRSTNLKEMFLVRYADDFRIFCRTKTQAEKVKYAVTQWIEERLKLEVSQEKTRVVNVKRQYSNFLGFKIKVHPKGRKQVVRSHIADKNLQHKRDKLVKQAKRIARPRQHRGEKDEIALFNSMVLGMQNYYRLATHISADFSLLHIQVYRVLWNRLMTQRGGRLVKTGRELTKFESERYGGSRMLRYVAGTDEPLYPVGLIQHKNPMAAKYGTCFYTAEGRKGIHDNLRINKAVMADLMQHPENDMSVECADNRISLFSAQLGKCAITHQIFHSAEEVSCYYINGRKNDKYENLLLVSKPIREILQAVTTEAINECLSMLNLKKEQLARVNQLREKAGLSRITQNQA